MENIEQVSSTNISQLFESDSVTTAAVEAVICMYDFDVVCKSLRENKTFEEYPELIGFTKVYQDDDCGFVHKAGSNTLSIGIIVLVPSEEIKKEHGDHCIQGYRVWAEYEFESKVDGQNFVVNFNCNSLEIEEEFISEIDDPLDPAFDNEGCGDDDGLDDGFDATGDDDDDDE